MRREINSLLKVQRRLIKEHFKKNHLPNLAKQLEKFGFPAFVCQIEKNDALTQEQEEAFHTENEQIVQAANEEALRAMEQLEQMAPPPVEEKPALIFTLKGCGQALN